MRGGANLPWRDSGRSEGRGLSRLAGARTGPRPRGGNARVGGRGDGWGGGGGGGGGGGEVWRVEVEMGVLGLQYRSVQTEGAECPLRGEGMRGEETRRREEVETSGRKEESLWTRSTALPSMHLFVAQWWDINELKQLHKNLKGTFSY